jgi:elongation factor G
MQSNPNKDIQRIRNVGIFAHIDAGKTTTSEAILYHTGKIYRIGRVDDGNTQLDWMEQERKRGITVTSAATTCSWKDRLINLIDTPGHIDFSSEVLRSIRVIDGAVLVLCGVGGVEPQTEAIWSYVERESIPRLIFINKLDRDAADFYETLEEIHAKLSENAVAVQVPVGQGKQFEGSMDVITGDLSLPADDLDSTFDLKRKRASTTEAVEEATSWAKKQLSFLLDILSDADDGILEERLSGGNLSPQRLKEAIRQATIRQDLVPVLCGSSLKNIGIPGLLDAIVSYLPAPAATHPRLGSRGRFDGDNTADSVLTICAFKTVADRYLGQLAWARIFTGDISPGQQVYNIRTGERDRISRIYRMHADKRERLQSAAAGDVVGIIGLRSARTGDIFSDDAHSFEVSSIPFPKPVISVALKPAGKDDPKKLVTATRRLCSEDPTLSTRFDPGTGELVLSGMGELHLEIAVDRLRSEYGTVAEVSTPRIAFRETIRSNATATGEYRKQSGGHGHFARVSIRIEPTAPGSGIVFENRASLSSPGGARGRISGMPRNFLRPVETGLRRSAEGGAHSGFPLTDVRIVLLGGQYHVVDSAGKDFEIAASLALKEAVRNASPVLLEPAMRFDVRVEEGYFGQVLADLKRRRGKISGVAVHGIRRNIRGKAPLSEVQGYATDLRNMTEGRGTFSLEFLCYEPHKGASPSVPSEPRRTLS